MNFIIFQNDKTLYKVYLTIIDYNNKIKITFIDNNRPSDDVLTSGFHEVLKNFVEEDLEKEDFEFTLMNDGYDKYTNIYKDDVDSVILSNDGSVYVEPKPPEPYIPTEEELAEQEKQSQIQNLKLQISELKTQLAETDYIFVKCYEASLVGKTIDEYNFEALHAERQSLREQINQLEIELSALETE